MSEGQSKKGRAHLWKMIEENVDLPFGAGVRGEEVEVDAFEWPEEGHGLYAVWERSGKRHRVDVNSLEWVKLCPKGFDWIDAYQLWRKDMD
jgi:hypothetical protein